MLLFLSSLPSLFYPSFPVDPTFLLTTSSCLFLSPFLFSPAQVFSLPGTLQSSSFSHQQTGLKRERSSQPLHNCQDVLESESESRSAVSDFFRPHGIYNPWNTPGQNTGVGSLSLLQGIFPMQGLNPGLPHCRQILYQLSHKEALGCS